MAEHTQEQHQPTGISARAVLWGGFAIAAGIVLAAAAAYLLWRWWGAPSGVEPLGEPNAGQLPAIERPQLQAAPQDERAQYFAEKRRLLDSWEWIDRQRGIARIPLEQAMQLMAARGAGPAQKERR